MKYKLDKELLKKIRESNNEEIELEITDDNKIELVKDNEFKIGDSYYFAYFNMRDKSYAIAPNKIGNINDIEKVKKDKSFKAFHTIEEAQEYINWLNIRIVVEETIDELGRPTREEVEDNQIELFFIYCFKDCLHEDMAEDYETQPFLCKNLFLDELMGKIGKDKVEFFYKNLWRFL